MKSANNNYNDEIYEYYTQICGCSPEEASKLVCTRKGLKEYNDFCEQIEALG